ncbi:MAG: NAD(P)-dependent oxidoreductase [Betaproteobacteria bacterium]|nr:NAD(P)-dependent oxidoreductase [Betaproteobacteria bacterium]
MRFAFIGFGEVAASFAAALAARGAQVAAYDVLLERNGGAESLRARAAGAAVAFSGLREAIAGSSYVFSTVTTTVAKDAARECAAYLAPGQTYVDLNATEPSVKIEIGRIVSPTGAAFVEGAVLGAVGVTGARTEILFGGAEGERAARELSGEFGLNVRFYSKEIGKASTFKMLRSVFSKGMEALLLEFLAAGERAGIREDLWREATELFSANSFEKVAANWVVSHATAHERRYHEMEQVSGVLRALGVEPVMTGATEALFRRSVDLRLKEAFAAKPDSMDKVVKAFEERLRAGGKAVRGTKNRKVKAR